MKKSRGLRKSKHKKAAKKKAEKKPAKKPAFKKAVKKSVSDRFAPRKLAANRISGTFVERKNMITAKDILVVGAQYVRDLILSITFSDGKTKEVDFSTFFNTDHPSYLDKYKMPSKFKTFKIQEGNVVWGRDWDLIFPISSLYTGKIN